MTTTQKQRAEYRKLAEQEIHSHDLTDYVLFSADAREAIEALLSDFEELKKKIEGKHKETIEDKMKALHGNSFVTYEYESTEEMREDDRREGYNQALDDVLTLFKE